MVAVGRPGLCSATGSSRAPYDLIRVVIGAADGAGTPMLLALRDVPTAL